MYLWGKILQDASFASWRILLAVAILTVLQNNLSSVKSRSAKIYAKSSSIYVCHVSKLNFSFAKWSSVKPRTANMYLCKNATQFPVS